MIKFYQSNEDFFSNDLIQGKVLNVLIKSLRDKVSLEEFIEEMKPGIQESIAIFFNSCEKVRSYWNQEVDNYRVFCMSEIPDSELMWAHYGGDHKGAVINFRIMPELDRGLSVSRQ